VKDCLLRKYEELPETKSWYSDPLFRKVLDPLNSGDNAAACREAETLVERFPDFADLYYWWGKGLLNMGSYEKARQILLGALPKTRQKYPILTLLGEVEWKDGSLSKAVRWWVQALHCQESLERFGDDVVVYGYLYYVADAVGLSQLASSLVQRVDYISPGKPILSPQCTDSLIDLIRRSDTAAVRAVLEEVKKSYFPVLHPSKSRTTGDDEVASLIKIAQDKNEGYDVRGKAIQRLGEIGDQRAIEPLMRIYRSELHLIRLDARDAVEKIRCNVR
jgi:tetratricopeptide (TPR) repeat protein